MYRHGTVVLLLALAFWDGSSRPFASDPENHAAILRDVSLMSALRLAYLEQDHSDAAVLRTEYNRLERSPSQEVERWLDGCRKGTPGEVRDTRRWVAALAGGCVPNVPPFLTRHLIGRIEVRGKETPEDLYLVTLGRLMKLAGLTGPGPGMSSAEQAVERWKGFLNDTHPEVSETAFFFLATSSTPKSPPEALLPFMLRQTDRQVWKVGLAALEKWPPALARQAAKNPAVPAAGRVAALRALDKEDLPLIEALGQDTACHPAVALAARKAALRFKSFEDP